MFVVPLLPWLSAGLLAAAYFAGSTYALHSIRSPEIMAHSRVAPGADDVRFGELIEFSIASGGATLLNAAAVLFLIRFVETRLGASALGLVTMALMVSQIALMPVTLAAPLVFKHLMTHSRHLYPTQTFTLRYRGDHRSSCRRCISGGTLCRRKVARLLRGTS